MSRKYASAQSAVDAWARYTCTLRNVGAVGYDPEQSLKEGAGDSDPSALIDARRDLTAVFEEAKRRADSLAWVHWTEHRFLGRALPMLSVEVPDGEDVDRNTYAQQQIREVDDVVEQVLDEKGMLETEYSRRRDDQAAE